MQSVVLRLGFAGALVSSIIGSGVARATEGDLFGAAPEATTTPPGGSSSWSISAGHGKAIAVFDPVGIGVENEPCLVVGDLIRTELVKLGRAVTPRDSMKVTSCGDVTCAAEQTRALIVPEGLVTRLSRLGQKVIVTVSLVDAGSSIPSWSDRITTESLDDLDVLAGRIARAANDHVTLASTMTPDTVTGNEGREQRRQKSLFSPGVRIGGLVPFDQQFAGAPPLYDVEAVGNYEIRQFMIETSIGYRGNNNDPNHMVSIGTLDLGAYWMFRNADISPFLGGGLGIHAVELHEVVPDKMTGSPQTLDSGGGAPSVWAGGGVALLRSANVHVLAYAKFQADFIGIGDQQVQSGILGGLAVTYSR